MRAIVEPQLPLTTPWVDHPHAAELRVMSELLDEHPELARMAREDLVGDRAGRRGRPGLSGEQALRVLVIKQLNGFSYAELAFHLADSRSYRTFCRFGSFGVPPRKSALQDSIARLRSETLETVNRVLIRATVEEGLETGGQVRIDTTVTETNIHHPTDSSLLYDCVRVLGRLLKQAHREVGIHTVCGNHTKAAKRRLYRINQAKRQVKRLPFYRELIRLCEKTVCASRRAIPRLRAADDDAAAVFANKIDHYVGLAAKVIDQTRRRVLQGESVPASEKVVSIFEDHTDVIRKGGRDTEYGHKLCLSVGSSTLVLDCTIEDGAPVDSKLAVEMVRRLGHATGRLPEAVAFDGGFSSVANLAEIKEMGVSEVMFHRKATLLDISAMTSTPEIHRALWRFRAGVEGCVSFLKRCFGLRRATWRGRAGFHRFVRASILTANLLTIARLRLKSA